MKYIIDCYKCYICNSKLEENQISANGFGCKGAEVTVDCIHCGKYTLDRSHHCSAQVTLWNLKATNCLSKKMIETLTTWIKNNPEKIINHALLKELFPIEIDRSEKKLSIKQVLINN